MYSNQRFSDYFKLQPTPEPNIKTLQFWSQFEPSKGFADLGCADF